MPSFLVSRQIVARAKLAERDDILPSRRIVRRQRRSPFAMQRPILGYRHGESPLRGADEDDISHNLDLRSSSDKNRVALIEPNKTAHTLLSRPYVALRDRAIPDSAPSWACARKPQSRSLRSRSGAAGISPIPDVVVSQPSGGGE